MIIPAILENNIDQFQEKLDQLKQLKVKHVQVDFVDGDFVDGKTLAIEDLPVLPKGINFEAHLMVQNPSNFIDYRDKGFSKVIIHYEAFDTERDMEKAAEAIKDLGMTAAIAINPETIVSVLTYDTDTISDFTILSVHPGKQGQKFLRTTLAKVKELKDLAPKAKIEVDGGVTDENIKEIIESGADDCAVGSSLFKEGDVKANYEKLEAAIK